LDTIKHADLGGDGNGLVIDFYYAYNPSCAYNPRWVCPLSPIENCLDDVSYFEHVPVSALFGACFGCVDIKLITGHNFSPIS